MIRIRLSGPTRPTRPSWPRAAKALAALKSLCLGLASIAMLAAAAPAAAESTTKIGYIDIDIAVSRSQTIQAAVTGAENEQRRRQEEMEILIRRGRRSRDDLQARRSVLSEDEIRRGEARIDALLDEIELMRLEIEKNWRRITTKVMEPAVDRILATVREVGKAEGFDLIVRADVVLYGIEALDITPLVIESLDRPASPEASPALPDSPQTED